MFYKVKMVLLKLLFVPMAIVILLITALTIIFCAAYIGVLYVMHLWVEAVDSRDVTESWNEMIKTIGLDYLTIENKYSED